MKPAIPFAAIALFAATPAVAETVRLTTNQAAAIAKSLADLDNGWESDGKKIAFLFDAETRLKIATDIRVLSTAVDDFQRARRSLMLTTPDADKKDSPAQLRFYVESDRIASIAKDFDVEKLSAAQLRLGDGTKNTNPMPINTLSAIGPILAK